MVDRCWQVLKKLRQGGHVVGVEGRDAFRAHFPRRLLEPVGIAADEDDVGTFRTSASSGLQPDACAAADHDDGLPGQFGFAPGGKRSGCAGHGSSGWVLRMLKYTRTPWCLPCYRKTLT